MSTNDKAKDSDGAMGRKRSLLHPSHFLMMASTITFFISTSGGEVKDWPLMDLVSKLAMIAFIFGLNWWLDFDAKFFKYRFSKFLRFLTIFMPLIGVICYAFASRDSGSWILLLKMFGYVVFLYLIGIVSILPFLTI